MSVVLLQETVKSARDRGQPHEREWRDSGSLGQGRVSQGENTSVLLKVHLCLEVLAEDKRVDWNIRATGWGWTPLMSLILDGESKNASILLDIPRVDLDKTDEQGDHLEDIARYQRLSYQLS